LFSADFEIDGWQYGFLQGANKSQRRLAGSDIGVLLFTRRQNTERYFVGELERCWILTEQQANEAHAALEKKGVISRMVEAVRAVGGDTEFIEIKPYRAKWTLDIINIRYRPEHGIRYSQLVKVPGHSPINKYNRYQLIRTNSLQIAAWHEATRGIEKERPVAISPTHFPQEVSPGTTYFEGGVDQVLVNRYERDPRARAACLKHYGSMCIVCGFASQTKYGPEIKGLIQVHHLRPLSEIREGYEVSPIDDLRPVCPNCHAVIHHGGGCRSIDDVKRLLLHCELLRRADEANADPDRGIPWEQVKAKGRAQLRS
jgi:hypothetical protein